MLLCGGKGTRAYPETIDLPKALLPVAGLPVVERVMGIFARQGHRRFVLAAGHLGEQLAARYADPPNGWEIEVVDTGTDTETGERVRRAATHVRGDRFFASYADGLGNVHLDALVEHHVERGALATITTVPLPSQYGTVATDRDGRIVEFREKPRLLDHWINAGFFVFDRAAFDHWHGDDLEREVLPALSRLGRLFAYRHLGFWKSMDTFKDRQELSALGEDGNPPWDTSPSSPQWDAHASTPLTAVRQQ